MASLSFVRVRAAGMLGILSSDCKGLAGLLSVTVMVMAIDSFRPQHR